MPTTRENPLEPLPWPDTGALPGDLRVAKAQVYDPCGFRCSPPVPEAESPEYAAHTFTLDGRAVRFRAARTTPTKAGQFVTVWKRSPDGPIAPFDTSDPVDLFVIGTRDGDRLGQFVLSMETLRRQGIVSTAGVGGKRAFRVYPPWVATTNRQAERAQQWQLEHFLTLPTDGPVDPSRARQLYHPRSG
ncbi:MepB family protein [Kitasatospora sp. NPDC101801]|uniref:MepB family protein n=1 Tax=Kitasatospora sp. NPDC101801 TaxID=3364103 RepID=UPI00382E1BB1